MQSTRLLRCLIWTAAASLAASCAAQVQQPPGTMPDGRRVPIPSLAPHPQEPGSSDSQSAPAPNPAQPDADVKNPAAPPAPAAPALPPSLLDKPPQPAKVVLAGGQLSVEADNSSLHAILDAVQSTSGMTVDGFGKDQRIFGHYGPGNPRDILSSLLEGAGYNILMVGATDSGAPRTLILTDRSNAPPALASSEPGDQDQDTDNNPPEQPETPIVRPINPGPPEIPDQNGHVRSPAEILQELQRMRSEQQPQ